MSDEELSLAYESDEHSTAYLIDLLEDDAQKPDSTPQPPKTEDDEPLPLHTGEIKKRYIRVSVVSFGDRANVRTAMADEDKAVDVDLSGFGYLFDEKMLKRGTQLNLVDCKTKGENLLVPRIVVLEPDYLIDISGIAKCFSAYAETADLNIMNKLEARTSSSAILLGNYAGQFLDECVTDMREGRAVPRNYRESARKFFRNNALELASVKGVDQQWHAEARQQQTNVALALEALKKDQNFDVNRCLTEPSFLSEALGVQGRMDLLQNDMKVLIEQKSGKMETFGRPRPAHREEHYVQVALYQLLLTIGFGVDPTANSQYLFYSKYNPQDGLLHEGANVPAALIDRIFEIRNGIVHNDLRYTSAKELKADLDTWTPQYFRQKQVNDKFWEPWVQPRLSAILAPIHRATETEKAYFYNMLAFVQRESVMARLGGAKRESGNGFCTMWTLSAKERYESGDMLQGLTIVGMEIDAEEAQGQVFTDVVDIVTLKMPTREETDKHRLPNFRVGDIVVLYDYVKDEEPDVRRTMENRATIIGMNTAEGEETLKLKLRSSQSKKVLMAYGTTGHLWAIEHDMLDSQNTNTMRQLHALLRTTPQRRELLLGERKPAVYDRDVEVRDCESLMPELVKKVAKAKEMFLLVGPPGTGKTSYGLVAILREELLHEGHNVLLMAYTNRAVDEICAKLEKEISCKKAKGEDAFAFEYLRIGSRYACDERYRDRLLGHKDFAKMEDLLECVNRTRVFVGTTAAIGGKMNLFDIKHFDLAIVDEASQILEPQIVGILSAKRDKEQTPTIAGLEEFVLGIDRFVLIGDQKQLPAVVTQSKEESQLDEPLLKKIGLTDCRHSFFERMIRLLAPDGNLATSPYIYTLTRQGRMHPETAEFCNKKFYGGKLTTVPLEHQKGELRIHVPQDADELSQLLSCRRVLYLDSAKGCETESLEELVGAKVNMREAEIVAGVVQRVYRMRRALLAGDEESRAERLGRIVGVVVPYRNQIVAIRELLVGRAIDDEERDFMLSMTIDTVERFQGSERDVIVYGFTVHTVSQLAFLTESQFVETDGTLVDRKLNVALSRAREQLVVVGDSTILERVPLFKELIDFCKERE